MRITHLKAKDVPPIKHFEISDLGSIVIIAGANGSGKTRLKEAIVKTFRKPASPQVDLTIASTRDQERSKWEVEKLEVRNGSQNQKLVEYMGSRTRGGTYTGSVIQVDSNRSVEPVKFQPLTFDIPDPDEADITYTYYLNPFTGRWTDLVNKIYRKAATRDQRIAQFVKENPEARGADALAKFPDPFEQYQKVFAKLLPGKRLDPIDPKQPKEFQYRVGDSKPLPFATLGSGEQEVVKVAFDLIWKKIRHCIILVDEPELHLHPTLTFSLIETLKDIGDGTNQFFFFTHSADLISTYYTTRNVFFIDSEVAEGNQARQLSTLDHSHAETARRAAANLGMFAVGKRIVFIEGEKASIDRLTYHKVSQATFPEAYLWPIGSVENISALRIVVDELSRAIFGVGLFMIRDRDGLLPEQVASLEANPRMRCLKRRHIENYFLDATLLSKVATQLYLNASTRDPQTIEEKLLGLAQDSLKTAVLLSIKEHVRINGCLAAPQVRAVESKDWSEIRREITGQVANSHLKCGKAFSKDALSEQFLKEQAALETSLENGTWKTLFPGKIIFSRFCGQILKQDDDRVRQAYVDLALKERRDVLQDIFDIFAHFKTLQ